MNVLSVGYDRRLLARRNAILEPDGYFVADADSLLNAIRLLDVGEWNVVILDSSVPIADTRLLAKVVQTRSTVPILLLASGSQFFENIPGVEMLAGAGHDGNALLRAVAAITARRNGALVQ